MHTAEAERQGVHCQAIVPECISAWVLTESTCSVGAQNVIPPENELCWLSGPP